jgi:hypothetical protein
VKAKFLKVVTAIKDIMLSLLRRGFSWVGYD